MEKIKVLIAEDMEPIRRKYVHVLSNCSDIRIVGDTDNGPEAVLLAQETNPDVILMDIEMGSKDAGLIAAREILSDDPNVKIVILTVYEEDELIFSAFQMGCCDYMLKNSSNEEIIGGIKAAYHNHSPIRANISGKIRNEFRRVKNYETSFLHVLNLFSHLTETELDVLYLLSCGYTRSEICALRIVEMSTVKTQIHSILRKFGKKTISELTLSTEDKKLLELVIKHKYLK